MTTNAGKVVALDERRLLARHSQGDATAFAELVRWFRAPVYGYLVRCGLERSLCDDLFQEIFLKIHHAASSYEADRPLKPWVFTIVINTVRSHWRRERVRQLVQRAAAPGQQGRVEQASADPRADDHLAAQDTAAVIGRALSSLPYEQREVVLLCGVEQMEQKDVALMLAMPLGTVKTHLHRGRAALALALSRAAVRANREVSR